MSSTSGDAIGGALHAEAEAALAEIRAMGITCPSCGVNIADVPDSHRLAITVTPGEHEAECAAGRRAELSTEQAFTSALNTDFYDDIRRAQAAARAGLLGRPGWQPAGILNKPAG